VLLSTIDDRVPQTGETAENPGVFAKCAAPGAADRRAEVTATRFEGVDAPSFQRANAGARPAAGLRDLARLHSRRLRTLWAHSASDGSPENDGTHKDGGARKGAPYNINRQSTAAARCRKEIA